MIWFPESSEVPTDQLELHPEAEFFIVIAGRIFSKSESKIPQDDRIEHGELF